jgi:membrane protease subunit HflK
MAGQSGGPWGGGGGNRGGGDDDRGNRGSNGRKPPEGGPQIPEIDELVRKGQDQLRVLMGGRGGSGGTGGTEGGGGPTFGRGSILIGLAIGVILWGAASFYTVRPEEQAVELFLGDFYRTTDPGLNFAPWPLVTYEKLAVTREQNEDIGVGGSGSDAGLMLTGDENIVDIDFQVVWNISDPAEFLFNLRDPQPTIRAVSESAMREIIAQSQLAPILNRDRGSIASRLEELIQLTLDSYDSGVNIIRVIDAFRDVQAAEQERDRLEKEADAYAAQVVAQARGEAAQALEEAEGYRAQVVNEAEGEASRFSAVLTEYLKAPEVTRKRLYLETMEDVLGTMDKIILDESSGGQGVVPYLPLNELRRSPAGGQ